MKPRWLLLAVSLICLLVLAPASAALSANGILLGCGEAKIDGKLGTAEWAPATPLNPAVRCDVHDGFPDRIVDCSAEVSAMNTANTLSVGTQVFISEDNPRVELDFDCYGYNTRIYHALDSGEDPEFLEDSCRYTIEGMFHFGGWNCWPELERSKRCSIGWQISRTW